MSLTTRYRMSYVQCGNDLFHKVADPGPGAIESQVRLLIRQPARGVEALQLIAVRCERPAPVGWEAIDHARKRHVEPDREPVTVDGGPVLGGHERAAARGDDQVSQRQQIHEDGALDGPEVRLAFTGEDRGDGAALPRFNPLVDVLRTPVEPFPQRARQRGLAGGHEPHEVYLIG